MIIVKVKIAFLHVEAALEPALRAAVITFDLKTYLSTHRGSVGSDFEIRKSVNLIQTLLVHVCSQKRVNSMASSIKLRA